MEGSELMKVKVEKTVDESVFIKERQELLEKYPEYSCDDAFLELGESKYFNNEVRFPTYCKTCWTVLVIGVSFDVKEYLANKYSSKGIMKKDGVCIVSIYAKSKDERDKIIRDIRGDKFVCGVVRYRFACRLMQTVYPEMFLSAGTPNPDYL